jgi:peptidoglycan hydrolase-like protein with peptidoglycan-binding domain
MIFAHIPIRLYDSNMPSLLSFVAGILLSGVVVTTVAPVRDVFSHVTPMIDAVAALASTGNFTSATCSIVATPQTSIRSGEPIALTITSTNTFATMEFNGLPIQSGYTTTVYPTETTTYSVLLSGVFGCKYTVDITTPTTGGICNRGDDVGPVSTNEAVLDIQQFLVDRNYPITKTGTFDVRTHTALKLFQLEKVVTASDNMRAVVTGTWDARTRSAVFSMYGCKEGLASDTGHMAHDQKSTAADTTEKVCLDTFIKPGVTNGDIIAIQSFLNTQMSHGTTPLETTGYYGSGTKLAIKAFQEANAAEILIPNNLTSGNGLWGPSTAKKASSLGLCEFVK